MKHPLQVCRSPSVLAMHHLKLGRRSLAPCALPYARIAHRTTWQARRMHTTPSIPQSSLITDKRPVGVIPAVIYPSYISGKSVKRCFYHASDQDPPPTGGSGTKYTSAGREGAMEEEELLSYFARLSDPRTIVRHLDEYIIGQDQAKKILAVAVFNHYNRVRANLQRQAKRQHDEEQLDISESAPHHNTEHENRSAASWPHREVSYYPSNPGGSNPTQASGDLVPVERVSSYGSSQQRSWSGTGLANEGSSASGMIQPIAPRHASGEGASIDDIDDSTVFEKSNVLLIGPTGSGKTLLAKTLAQILQVPFSMSDATPFTQAGYVGEDVELVIQRLLQACDHDIKKAETGIVFIDEIDKISRRSDSFSSSRDVSGEGVQQSLLRMLEGTVVNVTDKSAISSSSGQNKRGGGGPGAGSGLTGGGSFSGSNPQNKPEVYAVDTSNILFILSGAFIGLDKTVMDRIAKGSIGFDAKLRSASEDEPDSKSSSLKPLEHVEPADLVKYGLIPEFIGRVPVVASLNSLTVDDLVRILSEPKNSLLKQYQGLFELNKVDLQFSKGGLRRVAEEALEKKTGARGLRRIMENLLLEPMYESPNSYIRQVVIDSKVVSKEKPPAYLGCDQEHVAAKIIAEDDGVDSKEEESMTATMGQQQTLRREMTQM
ncbi:P-loop containing nucleoside triphosphate hydrolase protein [Fennellomyces sp. T-0311]|nr:P-loop containing nucleoside triphosphate hydrolase protein [Fennellomyces sp. T-0311]